MAQNKVTLSGKVIDQHGTPIAQATIAVENTTSGTYTDNRGKYSLQVAPGKHTFVVSFLGYQTVKQSLDIRQDKKQNFTLQESAVTLSSVEVYGKTQTQKVKEGAFAVNALDIKPIVNSLNNLNDLVNRTTGIKVREEGRLARTLTSPSMECLEIQSATFWTECHWTPKEAVFPSPTYPLTS